MVARPPAPALALLASLCALRVAAEPSSFTRFGATNGRRDCALVADVAGARRVRATVAACTDGDPTCDADGAADGTCTLRVRMCFDAAMPACAPADITHAEVRAPVPALAGLVDAVSAMTMPVAAETCTEVAGVPVALDGHRQARVVLRAAVSTTAGPGDRDRLVLSCRRAAAGRDTFATIERQIFARSCTSFSCHGAARAGGLSLDGDAAYANLVGVAPANDAARAAGLLRVAPGDPDRSFILRKLTGDLAVGEGSPMPLVGGPLPAARIDLVRRWIAAGAPASASF